MLKSNIERLPVISVSGSIAHPKEADHGRFDVDGKAHKVAGIGGITYNVQVGDPACGWVGDHIEPSVTIRNTDEKYNMALAAFACIGNVAEVVSGNAKGTLGFVSGKHGGCEHTIVHFPQTSLDKMMLGDTVLIKSCGQGLLLADFPKVQLSSVSPILLERMDIQQIKNKLHVRVSKIIPGQLMGSGTGSYPTATGDYDICLFSPKLAKKYDLDSLRLGDIVAIENSDTKYGRTYREGSLTIGVIIHGGSIIPGHGPGVTALMNARKGEIVPILDEKANLRFLFDREFSHD